MALKVRFHKQEIHNKFLSQNDTINNIFDALEQSRVEAKGSNIFKGIKSNIYNKHQLDLKNLSSEQDEQNEIIKAFRYVSYSELTGEKLTGKFNNYKKIINKKLGKKYDNFFLKLKKIFLIKIILQKS